MTAQSIVMWLSGCALMLSAWVFLWVALQERASGAKSADMTLIAAGFTMLAVLNMVLA